MSVNAYIQHERFIAPARAKPEIWRFLLGLGLGVAVMIALNLGLLSVLRTIIPPATLAGFMAQMELATTPLTVLIILASFGFMTIGVCVAVKVIHDRRPSSLIGPVGAAVSDFWAVAKILALLVAVIWILPPWDVGAPLVPNLTLGTWVALLPFSLMAVLIQTSAEEIVFRGYIQQQLAVRFSSRWIWMVMPSALFGLAHYVPAEAGENAWLIALWATLFGILMADLTARAGNLGPAIAVHFATNVSALLLTSLPDYLSGLALYTVPYDMGDITELRDWLPVDFAVMIVSWLAARLVIRR